MSSGRTGHTEAVQVTFDPDVVTDAELLVVLWDRHDATRRTVVTEIVAADGGTEMAYHEAEDYHQQYLEKGGQSADKGATARISCYGD